MWLSCAVAIDDSAVLLECIDDVHGGDCEALGVLSVGEAVPDHSLEKVVDVLAHSMVGGQRDALHSSPPGQSADGAVGDHGGGDGLGVGDGPLGGRAACHLSCFSFSCHYYDYKIYFNEGIKLLE